MSRDSENQKTLLGFMLGAAAGVAVGMLLAPFAGEENRKKLTNKANSLKNQFKDTLDQVTEVGLATLNKSKKSTPVENTAPAPKTVKKKAKKAKKRRTKANRHLNNQKAYCLLLVMESKNDQQLWLHTIALPIAKAILDHF